MRRGLVAPVLAAALLLTGCTEQGAQTGGDQLPDGSVVQQWQKPDTAPIAFSGPLLDGGTYASRTDLGKVVVVNFWYAGCAPCRAEAPTLKSLATEFAGDDVAFVGINTIDSKGNAQSFERDYATGYPSILDQAGGAAAQLAFAEADAGVKVTPTTLVLDRKGRLTARILGKVNGSVLKQFIQDAVDGSAA